MLNVRGKYLRKSKIAAIACVTDKVKVKAVQKITNITREKRTCKLHKLCKFLCCPMDPQIHFISLYYSQLGYGWRNVTSILHPGEGY